MMTTIRRLHNRCKKHVDRHLAEDRERQENHQAVSIAQEGRPNMRSKKFEKYKKKHTKKDINIGLLDAAGTLKMTDQERAKIHAERLLKTHSYPSDPNFDDNWREQVDVEVERGRAKLTTSTTPKKLLSTSRKQKTTLAQE